MNFELVGVRGIKIGSRLHDREERVRVFGSLRRRLRPKHNHEETTGGGAAGGGAEIAGVPSAGVGVVEGVLTSAAGGGGAICVADGDGTPACWAGA